MPRFVVILVLCGFLAACAAEGPPELTPADPIVSAIIRQLPRELPEPDSLGWPQTALRMGYIAERIGQENRARQIADELWAQRDPETGLWRNWAGEVDFVNPFYAVLLYENLGQHDRALAVHSAELELARAFGEGAYNWFWWPVLSSIVAGEPMPMDLFVRAAPGFTGAYAPYENDGQPSEHGRFYADVMATYWRFLGGPDIPLYGSNWCKPKALGRAEGECAGFYQWARGKRYLPILKEPYNFWNDETLMYSLPGLGYAQP